MAPGGWCLVAGDKGWKVKLGNPLSSVIKSFYCAAMNVCLVCIWSNVLLSKDRTCYKTIYFVCFECQQSVFMCRVSSNDTSEHSLTCTKRFHQILFSCAGLPQMESKSISWSVIKELLLPMRTPLIWLICFVKLGLDLNILLQYLQGKLSSTARPGVSIYWLGYVENWLGWADLSIP